jgi:hypothetical protein
MKTQIEIKIIKIYNMLDEGYDLKGIHEKTGISKTTIRKHMHAKNNGVSLEDNIKKNLCKICAVVYKKPVEYIPIFRELPKTGNNLADWFLAHKPLTSDDFNKSIYERERYDIANNTRQTV